MAATARSPHIPARRDASCTRPHPIPLLFLSRLIEFLLNLIRRFLGGSTPGSGDMPPKFLICPRDKEESASATIGPAGGTLQLREHRLDVPPGAVSVPVEFSATLLPSRMLKLRIEADGKPSFNFAVPATLTLGFGRCDPPSDARNLRVYKIDPATDNVLRDLGGRVNPQAREVSASLDGLSVYTLGSPP